MRPLTCLLMVVICTTQITFGQDPTTIKCRMATLTPEPGPDSTRLPISHVEIRDVRRDSSKFGFYRTPGMIHYKYCLDTSSHFQLNRFANGYLRKNFDSAATGHTVIYIRDIWISTYDSSLGKVGLECTKAYFKAEFYLYRDGFYQPLFRYDSSITKSGKPKRHSTELIEDVISNSLDRLKQFDFSKTAVLRKITGDQVSQYYSQLSDMPVLKSPAVAKGIYNSFSEFKQNKPSDTAFEIRFESLADVLYVKDKDGNSYVKRKLWGVCDGENVYIKFGHNFFQLFRQQDTWEFYGSDKLFMLRLGSTSPFRIPSAPMRDRGVLGEFNMLQKFRFYQLDMQTGDIKD